MASRVLADNDAGQETEQARTFDPTVTLRVESYMPVLPIRMHQHGICGRDFDFTFIRRLLTPRCHVTVEA